LRCGVNISPATKAKPKISIECLVSKPIPAISPKWIQSLSLPVRIMRISTSAHPIQHNGSKALTFKK
jgi:hypothetical protein